MGRPKLGGHLLAADLDDLKIRFVVSGVPVQTTASPFQLIDDVVPLVLRTSGHVGKFEARDGSGALVGDLAVHELDLSEPVFLNPRPGVGA